MKNTLIIIGLLLISNLITAQVVIETENNLILVYNNPDNHFYIEIEGDEIIKTDYNSIFVVDKRLVQINVVNINKFVEGTAKSLSQIETINQYIHW